MVFSLTTLKINLAKMDEESNGTKNTENLIETPLNISKIQKDSVENIGIFAYIYF